MTSMFNSPNFEVSGEAREVLNKLVDVDGGRWERIANNIELFWGRKECHDYFIELMKNDHNNRSRMGFPVSVSGMILTLANLHTQVYEPPPVKLTMWNIWD